LIAQDWHETGDDTQTRRRFHHDQEGVLLSHDQMRPAQFPHHAHPLMEGIEAIGLTELTAILADKTV